MSRLQVVSDEAFLDATATLAVTALRSVGSPFPLSATLMLGACAASGLELAAIMSADFASSDAASSTSLPRSQMGAMPCGAITG